MGWKYRINWIFIVGFVCAIVVMIMVFCSSDEQILVQKTFIGIIEDANVVPVSWGEYAKIQIRTDRAFIVVMGNPYVTFGDSCFIYSYGNVRYASWPSAPNFYLIGG